MNDFELTSDGKFAYGYPRAAMTTDSVIFGFDGQQLNVLLIQRGIDPYKGAWAFPGGFLRMEETLEECAQRELKEETGLDNIYMEQFGTFSEVERDPRWRVVTTAFYALVKISEVKGGDDAADAKWFPINQVPTLTFDHDRILRVAMRKLREDLHFRPVGFELLPEKFTMPQLQHLYEAILGVHFDRRNFMKKMLYIGILDDTGEKQESHAHRSATYFRFNKEKYGQLKAEGTLRLEF